MASTQYKIPENAVRPLYAVAGATDLAVELARGYVADAQARVSGVQKRVQSFDRADLEPKALQARARKIVDQRQARIEKVVTDLQTQARSYANETVGDLTETYDELATRGQRVVTRIRKQEATEQAVAAAKNTESAAKATVTSAKKGAAATRSRAKATGTSARKTAKKAAKAVSDGAEKLG